MVRAAAALAIAALLTGASARAEDVEVAPSGVTPEAVKARSLAAAFLSAGLIDKAHTAIHEALQRAPGWVSALQLSVRIHLAQAGPESELEALARPATDEDYAPVVAALQGALTDLEAYCRLADRAADLPEALEKLTVLRSRVAAAARILKVQTERRAANERRRRAEEAVRAAEEQARATAAARVEAEQRAREEKRQEALRLEVLQDVRREAARQTRLRRRAGYVVTGLALVPGVLAGAFAYLGSEQNDTIKRGVFATSSDIKAAAAAGSRYNAAAIACGVVAGVAALVGVPLVLFNLESREARVAPIVVRGGAGLAFGVRLP